MNYFIIKRSIFIVSSNKCCGELEKIDKCIDILNKSGIGKIVPFESYYHQRNRGGKLYKFTGCNICNYSYICKKNLKSKELDYRLYELVPDYELLKEEVRENLLSPKGIEIRINRSIQVEGTFRQLKQNMQ